MLYLQQADDPANIISRRRIGSMPGVKTLDEKKNGSPGKKRSNPGYETIASVHGGGGVAGLLGCIEQPPSTDIPPLPPVPRRKQERSTTDSETMHSYTIRKAKQNGELSHQINKKFFCVWLFEQFVFSANKMML